MEKINIDNFTVCTCSGSRVATPPSRLFLHVRGPRAAKMSDIALCSEGGSWGRAEPRWEVYSPVGGSTGCLCNLVEGSTVIGLSETLLA